jgi:DNA-binding response OmpR family regulator
MPRILLVEDDPTLGEMLKRELESATYEVEWAEDAASGLAAFHRQPPDLLLLDLMLPDTSGFVVLEKVREVASTPVILLTARHMNQDKVRGLDLGADDYVTKPFWNDELLARIRARLRRKEGESAPSRKRRVGAVLVDLDARSVSVGGASAHLSPTEFALLAYLLERDGRAVRSEQLIEAVLTGEESTRQALQTHMSRLRKKLHEDGERILTVWGIGYRVDTSDRLHGA